MGLFKTTAAGPSLSTFGSVGSYNGNTGQYCGLNVAEGLAYRAASPTGKEKPVMGVGFGRSSVADLSFHVFNRALHPDWFATRAFRRIEQFGWEVDLRIIEGGHSCLFHCGSDRLTEILSGPETVLPEPGLLFHSHLRRERSTLLRPSGTIEYQSCLEVERVDIAIFRHLCDEMTIDASESPLFHRFASCNRLLPPPISQIRISARIRDLSIQSFHTFPEECAIVRTQSLFELKSPSASR
jgi:hypothetical protein